MTSELCKVICTSGGACATVMSHGRVKWHSRPQILRVLDCARRKREELWGKDCVKWPRSFLIPELFFSFRMREERFIDRSPVFAIFYKLPQHYG